MKNLILLTVFSISIVTSSAQNCSKELLAQKPGIWKAYPHGSTPNVSASDLVKEKAVLARIHQMISLTYQPKGCQLTVTNSFSGAYLPAGKNWVADNFLYSMYIKRYLCDKNSTDKSKYYVDISTTTKVEVQAGKIGYLNLSAADLPDDEMRGYLKLTVRPQIIDGFYFMGEEVVGNYDRPNKTKTYRWLITYDEQLPFEYVSRKEYLLLLKRRLKQTIQAQSGDVSYYDEYVNRINENLKQPEAELSMPAICMWNDEERFTRFVQEGTKGSFIAIKPNLNYYNKKLSRSTPQFFSVVYTLTHGDPVFEENIAAIQKAINFSMLKNMLGKEAGKVITENKISNPTKRTAPISFNKNAFDEYKNETTPGFKPVPVYRINNAAQHDPPVNSKIKSKTISIQLTTSMLPVFLNQLPGDMEKQSEPATSKNILSYCIIKQKKVG